MTQLLAAAGPYTLTKTWYVNGSATDVGDVTIGIIDGNGDTVVASGTATTNNADGTYTYSLADQPNPDVLKVTWTRSDTGADLVDRLEIVGGFLFTENQARTFNAKADATSALKPLNSSTEYPDATIADERRRITDDLENWTGRSWIPRYARVVLKGTKSYRLPLDEGECKTSDGYYLHRPGRLQDVAVVLSATVGGTAVTTSNIVIDGDTFVRTDAYWSAPSTGDPVNVVVEYVYGLPYLADGVDRIALKLLLDRLVPSAFPERALSVDTDFGQTRFVQPGGPMGNLTRVPEVNEWLRAHNRHPVVW